MTRVERVLRHTRGYSRRKKICLAVVFGSGYVLGLLTVIVLTVCHWTY